MCSSLKIEVSESFAKMKTYTVVVEGNTASGKTTLMKNLMDKVQEFTVFLEPVDRWQYVPVENQLAHLKKKFLSDPTNYVVPYQLETYSAYADLHRTIVPTAIKVLERSIHSSQIFQQMMLEEGQLSAEKYSFLQESRKHWCIPDPFEPDMVIYLRTSPEICLQRITERNHNLDLPQEYLKRLHLIHDKYVSHLTCPVYHIDGADSPDSIFRSAVTAIFSCYCANRLSFYAKNSGDPSDHHESDHGAIAEGSELASNFVPGQTP